MLEILFEDAPISSSSSSSSAFQLSRLRVLRADKRLVFTKILEQELVSLGEMCIGRFPKVEIFKEIFRCDLESLPPSIHKFSSLKTLWLYDCPKLQALPVDGLPLSLELLVIAECPLLYERCQVESGSDWHNIKHIPEKEITQTIPDDRLYELARRFHFHRPYDLFDR